MAHGHKFVKSHVNLPITKNSAIHQNLITSKLPAMVTSIQCIIDKCTCIRLCCYYYCRFIKTY